MTTLTVPAGDLPVWLCFEPWATEYTVAPNTTVVIKFDAGTEVELTSHVEGITFMSLGRHPDIWSAGGEPLEIYSETMPETPAGISGELFGWIRTAVPPKPNWSSPNRLV